MVLLITACASPQRLDRDSITTVSRPAEKDVTIALLGSTGTVGGYILRQALAEGYPLRLLTRSPDKLSYLGDRVTLVDGDARDPAVIARLLSGSDVVISAIGPGPQGPFDLNSTVTEHILRELQQQPRPYLVVSGAGVVAPEDQRSFTGWMVRQLARLRYPQLLQDRQREYAALAQSAVDWRLLRIPLIRTDSSSRTASVSLQSPASFTLQAEELARMVTAEIEANEYRRQAPFVYSRN